MRRARSGRRSALVALGGAAARANPVDAFGFGSRATAMGGAADRGQRRLVGELLQPGGPGARHDLRIDIGYRYAQPLLALERPRQRRRRVARLRSSAWSRPAASAPSASPSAPRLWLPDQRLTRVRSLAVRSAALRLLRQPRRSASTCRPTWRSRSCPASTSAAGSPSCRARPASSFLKGIGRGQRSRRQLAGEQDRRRSVGRALSAGRHLVGARRPG